jgi:glycine cleavage system protein P-like pyridoxal-binding family
MLKLIKNNKQKNNNKKYNLYVIKTSKTGTNISMSRLCERCVVAVNNVKKSGIKINKIYYSNDDGTLTSTNITKLLEMNDHWVSRYYRKTNYKPQLGCCSDCS